MLFLTHHTIDTPEPITKNFGTCDHVSSPYYCTKFYLICQFLRLGKICESRSGRLDPTSNLRLHFVVRPIRYGRAEINCLEKKTVQKQKPFPGRRIMIVFIYLFIYLFICINFGTHLARPTLGLYRPIGLHVYNVADIRA